MNSKLARSLVSAVAVGALSFGAVACGGQEEEVETTETPRTTQEKTSPATVTETETVTEMETVTETETVTPKS
ncbi:MAG: hypothetical protein M3N32_09225 [Actinomycetota bacterium]|nr:hypothetical protein [Actinomycetota bacterium]